MTTQSQETAGLTFPNDINYNFSKDIRCPRCGKLLGRGKIVLGHVEIKCSRSKCQTTVRVTAHGVFTAPG